MADSGSGTLYNVGIFTIAGLSVMFAVNRINALQHSQLAAAHQVAAAPVRAEPASEPEPEVARNETVELRADEHGNFRTGIEVNGRHVDAMVDTGASLVAVPYEDALGVGVHVRQSDFTAISQTANGLARFAPVMLESVSVGSITIHNVPGMVSERGALAQTLLGMSFLRRLQRFEVSSGRLVLQ